MTITKTGLLRKDYTAAGGDTFAFDFIIYDEDHLAVYVDGVLQTVNVDYTIAVEDVENDSGGDVVFEVASTPAAGSSVILLSIAPYTQDTALALRDETFEETYDKAVILIKQLYEMLQRCIQLPNTSLTDGLTLPEPSAGYFLIWNDDEDGLENYALENISTGFTEVAISNGAIAFSSTYRNVTLTGEGAAADVLTDITGGEVGYRLTIFRKAGVAYNITVSPGSGLHMENDQSFTINSDYDNISFICKSSGVWVETGRVNAT